MKFTDKIKQIFSVSDYYKATGKETLETGGKYNNWSWLTDEEGFKYLWNDHKKNIEKYSIMLDDDSVESSFELINEAIVSLGWDILLEDETQKQFLKDNLNNLKYITFDNVIENLQAARPFGYQIAEQILNDREGKTYIDAIKFKSSANVQEFITDDFGNLIGILYSANGKEIKIQGEDLDRIVLYVYPFIKNGNFYGCSELRSIYREWRSKNILIKLMNIALEKQGDPTMIFHHHSSLESQKSKIQNLADSKSKNLVVSTELSADGKELIKKVTVDMIEPQMKGVEMFLKAIDYYSKSIRRKMGIPDDAGYTDTKYGSRSRAEEQLSIMYNNIISKAKRTEDLINEQIIKPLMRLNWPNDTYQNKIFTFNTSKEDISKEKAEVLGILIDKNIINVKSLTKQDWEYLANWTGFDIIRDRIKTIQNDPEPVIYPMPGQAQTQAAEVKAEKFQAFKDTTNYGRIEKFLDKIEDETSDSLQTQIKKIEQEYIEKIKPYLKKTGVNIDKIKLRVDGDIKGRMKKAYQESFTKTYLQGKAEGRTELEKKGLEFSYNFNFQAGLVAEIYADDKNSIGLQKWIKDWQKQWGIKLTAADRKKLDEIKSKAFTISGVLNSDIESKVEKIIIGNIDRLSVEQIFKMIQDEVFNPLLDTAEINGKEPSAWQLRTNIRTNMSTYFNNARMNEFNDPDIVNLVQGYMYSAIIDSSTTDFCRGHDQEKIAANDPRLPNLTPPAHYKCRSLLVPITIDEDFQKKWSNTYKDPKTGKTVNIESPAKGFGDF